VSTRYHTDIASGAGATAANLNAPLGQLDAALNPTYSEYAGTPPGTTVTAAGTFYAVAGAEVPFTPAYAGQVFQIGFASGMTFAGAAGATQLVLRITDGSNATVVDYFLVGRTSAATTSPASATCAGSRSWVAAAGDVGATRKAKLYATHSVNGTVVSCGSVVVSALWR